MPVPRIDMSRQACAELDDLLINYYNAGWYKGEYFYGKYSSNSFSKPEVKDAYAKQRGHFGYIPANITDFKELISIAQFIIDAPIQFIDLGSGIGDKVMLAKEYFGFNATGIEYTKSTYDQSMVFLKDLDVTLINGDAFKIPLKQYNLIYMYRPIAKVREYLRLLKRIMMDAAIGAIIVEILPFHVYDNTLNLEKTWQRFYNITPPHKSRDFQQFPNISRKSSTGKFDAIH